MLKKNCSPPLLRNPAAECMPGSALSALVAFGAGAFAASLFFLAAQQYTHPVDEACARKLQRIELENAAMQQALSILKTSIARSAADEDAVAALSNEPAFMRLRTVESGTSRLLLAAENDACNPPGSPSCMAGTVCVAIGRTTLCRHLPRTRPWKQPL